MPPFDPVDQARKEARLFGITEVVDAFVWVATKEKRVNILAEGDSWFEYPRRNLAIGSNANIIDWIEVYCRRSKPLQSNILNIASNGDTAAEMLSGKQRNRMESLLKQYGKHIHLLLFSGGGNDVVGKHDLAPLLLDYQPGMTAAQCLDAAKFSDKVDSIREAYEELIRLRDKHAPHVQILTHTYDLAQPVNQGAEFLWGIEIGTPWIYPYLREKNIPQVLDLEIVKILLGTFKTVVTALSQQHPQFHVVDTQGILKPGDTTHWLNEIHPTAQGFDRISQKIYAQMKLLFPQLP